jgi:hypothetical protein
MHHRCTLSRCQERITNYWCCLTWSQQVSLIVRVWIMTHPVISRTAYASFLALVSYCAGVAFRLLVPLVVKVSAIAFP